MAKELGGRKPSRILISEAIGILSQEIDEMRKITRSGEPVDVRVIVTICTNVEKAQRCLTRSLSCLQ